MDMNLCDFRYYSRGGRRYLAAFITMDNLRDIQAKTGLIEALNDDNKSFCYGVTAFARVNQWLVLGLDMRNDQPKRRYIVSEKVFKRDYKYMVRKNDELEVTE